MALVVDTDVFSFLLKNDTRAALYKPHTDGQFLIVSFMTVAEIERWARQSAWGARRTNKFEKIFRRYFIQHSTRDICRIWAQVKDDGRKSGMNIDNADAWIAATALFFNIPLVTHNAADFVFVNNLTVISEK